MTSGRCVKNDMVKTSRQCDIRQQAGELVKCGDLSGAGTGQLLFDSLDNSVGQNPRTGPTIRSR